MAKPFHELREQLLRAGVAPRHVRRYLSELNDHLADLIMEEQRAGRTWAAAESAALARLGSMHDLAQAMIGQRRFQSWSARAPWVIFGIAPLLLLVVAYVVVCCYLWFGWRMFLPGADTPFGVRNPDPIYRFSNIYFQAGKYYYLCAPVLVGWGMALIAARQRLKAVWPLIGLALIAWMGGTAQIQANLAAAPGRLGPISVSFFALASPNQRVVDSTAVPAGFRHIHMNFFAFGLSLQSIINSMLGALFYLSLMALPYVVWRLWIAGEAGG